MIGGDSGHVHLGAMCLPTMNGDLGAMKNTWNMKMSLSMNSQHSHGPCDVIGSGLEYGWNI